MLSDYRSEKWYNIFTDVLLKTLRSAFLSSSVPDFIECSVEALSTQIEMEDADRIIVLENLWKVFHCVPPIAPSQIAPELKRNWEISLAAFKKTITIDMDKISELLQCSVTFEKSQICQNDVVRVNAFIKSASTASLKLRDFAIYLTDTVSNFKLAASYYTELNDRDVHKISKQPADFHPDDASKRQFDGAFMLEPNVYYMICFQSQPNQFAESSELQVRERSDAFYGFERCFNEFIFVCSAKVSRFEVLMGSTTNFIVLSQSSTMNKTNSFKSHNPKHDCLENFNAHRSCYVVPMYAMTNIQQITIPID